MEVRKGFAAIHERRHNSLTLLLRITACLLLITVLACSPTRMARGGMGSPRGGMPLPQQTPEEIFTVLRDRLNLTEEQEAKVKPIIEEQCETRDEIITKFKGQGRESRRSMRSALQAHQEVTEEKPSAVLTEEQMEEYRKIQEEQRQRMREQMEQKRMGKGRRGGMGGMGGGRGGMGGMGWPHGF